MPPRYPSADDIAEMRARGYDHFVIEEAIERSKRREVLEQLKTKIRTAFTNVRLGSGVGLREAQALDGYADEATCAACREKDEKDDWQAIATKDLNECSSSLSFFDADGMRFHLPAYLTADLDGAYQFGMAFCLTQCTGEQFALLNGAQGAVVREYLIFIEEEPDYEWDREHIRRAIEEYWAQ
jgi:hypothetical protein